MDVVVGTHEYLMHVLSTISLCCCFVSNFTRNWATAVYFWNLGGWKGGEIILRITQFLSVSFYCFCFCWSFQFILNFEFPAAIWLVLTTHTTRTLRLLLCFRLSKPIKMQGIQNSKWVFILWLVDSTEQCLKNIAGVQNEPKDLCNLFSVLVEDATVIFR